MTNERVEQLLERVAGIHGITVHAVRKAIRHAIDSGLPKDDPSVREEWNKIPHQGDFLTEEDVLIYLINRKGRRY